MRKFLVLIVLGLAVAMPLIPASAQQPAQAAQAAQLDARAVVAQVREIIQRRWAVPEARPALDAILAEGLASGRYDVADPALLATRIDEDLKRLGRDRHLGFEFNPSQAAIISARENEEEPDPSAFERQVRLANHGVSELRLLPGNVRYMAYDQFWWIGPESAAALDNAMRFLAGGDAIIIDLRKNGGGYPEAAHYLISHFMEANQLLSTFYEGEQIKRGFTTENLPAGRSIGKPLYILVGGDSASASEALAGMVKGHRLGEVVGETTQGAGLSNELIPVGGQFVLSVATARVVLNSTGGDWEAVGIEPTIATPASLSLDAAQAHALRRLAATAQAHERPRLEGWAEGFAARVTPQRPALPLAAYAASFGERRVRLEDGTLYYQNGERPRRLLVPLGGNRFTFRDDPTYQLRFGDSEGRVTALEIGTPGDPPEGRYERTE